MEDVCVTRSSAKLGVQFQRILLTQDMRSKQRQVIGSQSQLQKTKRNYGMTSASLLNLAGSVPLFCELIIDVIECISSDAVAKLLLKRKIASTGPAAHECVMSPKHAFSPPCCFLCPKILIIESNLQTGYGDYDFHGSTLCAAVSVCKRR